MYKEWAASINVQIYVWHTLCVSAAQNIRLTLKEEIAPLNHRGGVERYTQIYFMSSFTSLWFFSPYWASIQHFHSFSLKITGALGPGLSSNGVTSHRAGSDLTQMSSLMSHWCPMDHHNSNNCSLGEAVLQKLSSNLIFNIVYYLIVDLTFGNLPPYLRDSWHLFIEHIRS